MPILFQLLGLLTLVYSTERNDFIEGDYGAQHACYCPKRIGIFRSRNAATVREARIFCTTSIGKGGAEAEVCVSFNHKLQF